MIYTKTIFSRLRPNKDTDHTSFLTSIQFFSLVPIYQPIIRIKTITPIYVQDTGGYAIGTTPNPVEIPFHFMQHITRDCHKQPRSPKVLLHGTGPCPPKEMATKTGGEIEKKTKFSRYAHVLCREACTRACACTHRSVALYTCTVSSHVRCTSPYTRELVLYANQRARTITFPRRRYAFLAT